MDEKLSSIAEEQNSPQQLERLAAQRQLYSDAKRVLVMQVALVGIYPILATIIGTASPDMKAVLGLLGVMISLADATLIDSYQSACKRDASKIQELFDCTLFELPWPEFKLGAKPTVETVVRAASRYKKTDPNYVALRDWYPTSVCKVPLEYARVICQRINTWWDSTQRRTYANYLFAIVIVEVIVLVVVGLVTGSTLVGFFTTLATVSPLLIWGIREYKRQNDACNNTDRLRQKIEDAWSRILSSSLTDDQMRDLSRRIQDEICDQRKNNPLIFNWFYNRLRPSHEMQMQRGVEAYVNDILRKLNHT